MSHPADKPKDAEIFRRALEALSIGVALLDREGKVMFWNDGAERITGYHRHDAVGHLTQANILRQCNHNSCVHCGSACPITQATHDGKASDIQGYLHHKAGHSIPVRLRVHPIRDERGLVIAVAQSFEEERSGIEPELHQNCLAAHGCLDVVTGVSNHAFTHSHLRENLAFFQEYNLPFGILCIEVGGMDELRTTHGQEAVDVILHVVAQTMKHALWPDGFLGRWAENRFLAIVGNCGNGDLERAAQNVYQMANCSGIQWWGDFLSAAVSVGRAVVQSGDSMETLLERAFKALKITSNHSHCPASGRGKPSSGGT